MTLSDVIRILENADRIGAEADEPEGRQYIQLSETLVRQILEELREMQKLISFWDALNERYCHQSDR